MRPITLSERVQDRAIVTVVTFCMKTEGKCDVRRAENGMVFLERGSGAKPWPPEKFMHFK